MVVRMKSIDGVRLVRREVVGVGGEAEVEEVEFMLDGEGEGVGMSMETVTELAVIALKDDPWFQ